jgi:hypothetical protein
MTVTACEGAGTVILKNPTLVQGMGGRMSGLVETEPIGGIIKGILNTVESCLIPQLQKLTR